MSACPSCRWAYISEFPAASHTAAAVVTQGVERHIAKGRVLKRVLVPVARHRRAIERPAGSGALPPPVAALDRANRHDEDEGRSVCSGVHLRPSRQLIGQDAAQPRADLNRADSVGLRGAERALLARAVYDDGAAGSPQFEIADAKRQRLADP